MLGHVCSLVEENGLFVSAVGQIKRRRFPASLCLLFLAPLHATSTGTTGSARILCISPRLPRPLRPTSVDQNAEVCSPSPPLRKDECSGGCPVKSISAFLWLGGVDLPFDEPHLGGKDNLPLSVIYIVHQQPWLSEFAEARGALAVAVGREQAASEQIVTLRVRDDELQKSRTVLEEACTTARDGERRLDDEKRDSSRRLRDAQNRLQKFEGVATKPVCDLCGQEITGEHARQERMRLQQLVEECRRAVATVTQQHQHAVDLKLAKERELRELDNQIGAVRDSHGQAKREQQTACVQLEDLEKRLRRALGAMSESYREQISSAMPEERAAWLATVYPSPSDLEAIAHEVKGKAYQAHEVKRLHNDYQTWQGLHQQRAVFAQ